MKPTNHLLILLKLARVLNTESSTETQRERKQLERKISKLASSQVNVKDAAIYLTLSIAKTLEF